MTADRPALSASILTKEYGQAAARVHAVKDVSLQVMRGESVAIVGQSGCGKSSLLYLLGGLERPTLGSLQLAGERLEDLSEARLAGCAAARWGSCFRPFPSSRS